MSAFYMVVIIQRLLYVLEPDSRKRPYETHAMYVIAYTVCKLSRLCK